MGFVLSRSSNSGEMLILLQPLGNISNHTRNPVNRPANSSYRNLAQINPQPEEQIRSQNERSPNYDPESYVVPGEEMFQEKERRQSGKSMQIFVKTMNGNSVTLEVESSTTVANLKHQIIEYKVGSPQIKWNLFFESTPLEEGKTLSDYNIQECSFLHMAFELKEGALFCVRTLDGEPDFKVEIGRFDTLNDLKAKICERNGYPQNYQRFIFGEVQLKNGVIINQMDIIQTKLLILEDFESISSEDGFQPLLYFIPIMRGGGNTIYHQPKWITSSPLANISPNGSDDHDKESGIGNEDALKTQKAGPGTSQSRSNVLKKMQKRFGVWKKIQKRFRVRKFFLSKKKTDK